MIGHTAAVSENPPDQPTPNERWLTSGVAGIGSASLLADAGHGIPTALLPTLLTSTLGAPAAVLGVIEGVADGSFGRFCKDNLDACSTRSRPSRSATPPPPC